MAGATTYTVTDLGPLVRPVAINSSGSIVGHTLGVKIHAFSWQNGITTMLPEMSGGKSIAKAINNTGAIVGLIRIPGIGERAAMWQNGTPTDLGFKGVANGINDQGKMVGWTATGCSSSSSSVLTNVGNLGGNVSTITGINNGGLVIGDSETSDGWYDTSMNWQPYRHAFSWANGALTDLGVLPGGHQSFAMAINNSCQIVGASETNDGTHHAFMWQNCVMTDLGLQCNGASSASGINNLGQVVGQSTSTSGSIVATIWQSGTPVDLNTLIPAGSNWTLGQATGINDAGNIIGVGTVNGMAHGFVLTPAVGQ
jgi:probable HAF family extracellular repeat protein